MKHASAAEMALKNNACEVMSRPNELGFLMTAESSSVLVRGRTSAKCENLSDSVLLHSGGLSTVSVWRKTRGREKAGQRHGNSAAVKAARHMPGNRRERRDTHQTELMHDPAL